MPLVILLALSGVLLLAKRKPGGTPSVNKTGFWPEFLQWLEDREGDITTRADESTAHIPGTVTYNGKTYTNPTGSGGITADTFLTYANRWKFSPTVEMFAKLSDGPTNPLWVRIVTDIFDKGKRYSNNPVLATYLGSWYWGSGSIKDSWVPKIQAILKKSISDRQKLRQLVDLRKDYFEWVGAYNPDKQKYVADWKSRADKFYATFVKYA
jgi:hypothetical protein